MSFMHALVHFTAVKKRMYLFQTRRRTTQSLLKRDVLLQQPPPLLSFFSFFLPPFVVFSLVLVCVSFWLLPLRLCLVLVCVSFCLLPCAFCLLPFAPSSLSCPCVCVLFCLLHFRRAQKMPRSHWTTTTPFRAPPPPCCSRPRAPVRRTFLPRSFPTSEGQQARKPLARVSSFLSARAEAEGRRRRRSGARAAGAPSHPEGCGRTRRYDMYCCCCLHILKSHVL